MTAAAARPCKQDDDDGYGWEDAGGAPQAAAQKEPLEFELQRRGTARTQEVRLLLRVPVPPTWSGERCE